MTAPSLVPDSNRAAEVDGMLAALSLLDNTGLHAMDEALNSTSAPIEPAWLGNVLKARIAVAAIEWPDTLRPTVNAFTDAAGRLVQALENADVKAAASHATQTHKAQHALSNDGWSHLAKTAGIDRADEGPGHPRPHGTGHS